MALGLTPKQIIEKNKYPLLNICKDWERVLLGNIIEIQNGYAFSSVYFTREEGVPLIRIRDIADKQTENYFNGEYSDDFVVLKGDFLIGMDGDFKLSKWPGERGLLNQRVCRLRNESELYNKQFLFFVLQPYLNAIHSETSSVTVKHLSSRTIADIPIPLPPLPEQRTIVKKLESLFSSLDAGIADLKKAQQQLKIYRQAVLKKAFEGELTNTISKVEVVRLGSIIEKPKYGTSKKCTTEPIGKAVLRIPNINVGKINSEELKYAEFEDAEISALSLREGDILTIRSNGSVDIVGRCALISKKDTDFLYAGYLIRLRPNLEKANPKYLVHCLNSHNLRVQIEFKAKSTSGVNNINAGELESLEIPLFSLNEQNEIVKQIESRLSVCDSIEQNIKESLEKVEALRQSILKKAFEGNLLTAQELAECKLAEDYEPAGVLLERIKAEQIQSLKSEKKLKTKKDNHDRII